MDAILAAIVDDDRPRAKKLLQANPALATQHVTTARFYDAKIFHWIYVSDTALHLAAAGYRVAIVRMLLAAGADPNVENRRGGRPLHYAADGYITGPAWDAKRQVETLRRLLEGGAKVDARDKNGASALHRAV